LSRELLGQVKRHWPLAVGAGLAAIGLAFGLRFEGELRRAQDASERLEGERKRLVDAAQRAAARVAVEEDRRAVLAALVGVSDTRARLAVLEKALAVDPSYWEGRCERVRLLRRLALERRRAGDEPGALEAGRSALDEARAALRDSPSAPRAPLLLLEAEVARRELGDIALAQSACAALAACEGDANAGQAAYGRARVLLARGDVAAAGSACETAVARSPDLVPARFLEAELALRRRDAPGALAALDRALSLSDGLEDPEGFVLRALAFDVLAERGRALADLDRALELAPEDAEARRERGRVRLALGQPGPAAADLERALRSAPHDVEARLLRARAFALLGDREAARADLDLLEKDGVALPEDTVRSILGGEPPK
jgi:tetratricopeptide (TPR) repeat protein